LEKTDRPARHESRDIVELRNLKVEQPDLASAADMQIELLSAQRRIQSRVPLPSVTFDRRKPDRQQRQPMLQFKDIPIDWTDFRLMIRQTADILKRFETLDSPEYDHIQALARDGQIEAVVSSWYEAAMAPARRKTDPETGDRRLGPAELSAVRRRAGVRLHQSGGGTAAHLRALHRAMALRPDHLPVLRKQRPDAHHVVHQPRSAVSHLRVRCLPSLPEGVRRPRRQPPGAARGRFHRHAPARRRRDPAGISELAESVPE
jgi:hypothetical protein